MKRLATFLCLIAVGFVVLLPVKASAQETIDSYHVEMTAQKNGDLQVSEKIDYNFGSLDRHGIFRFIPLVSRVGDLYRVIDIKFSDILRDGKKEPYTVSSTGKQIEVKIGDPNRTILGPHTYEIDYTVRNGIGSNYSDHDEIYWNVTGNEWDVAIATASVSLKTDFGAAVQKAVCYTGSVGSTASDCQVSLHDGQFDSTTTSYLPPNEGLTIVAGFPVNTFPKSTLYKSLPLDPDLRLFLIITAIVFSLLNFVLAPLLLRWYLRKRNKTHLGQPVVNFDLPESQNGERISPAEAGTIDTTNLEKEDIVATIFDLAIRKYLKIEGTIKKSALGLSEKQDFTLTRLKENTGLNDFESYLMDTLFGGKKTTTLKDAKLTYTTFAELEKRNFDSLISRNFFTKNPKVQKSVCLVFGLMALFTGSLILGPVLLYLASKLNGRTVEGDETEWKLDGLKIFLKATKRYDVWQTKNFVFIESMIPYAMALGVVENYMKNLKVLKPDYRPSWYTGYGNFYSMYPMFYTTASSNVTTTAPSSSSGFSGGSSGGGGGGGGGGSW